MKNNYHTKFRLGENVTITSGLYKGLSGPITEYMPDITHGLASDNHARGITNSTGMYSIKIGRFKNVYVQEWALKPKA